MVTTEDGEVGGSVGATGGCGGGSRGRLMMCAGGLLTPAVTMGSSPPTPPMVTTSPLVYVGCDG